MSAENALPQLQCTICGRWYAVGDLRQQEPAICRFCWNVEPEDEEESYW
jgi:hypothetical protein